MIYTLDGGSIWSPPTNGDYGFKTIDGPKMTFIDVGKDGRVIAYDDENMYFREGVTPDNPMGDSWKKFITLDGQTFKSAALCTNGYIWTVRCNDDACETHVIEDANDDYPYGQGTFQKVNGAGNNDVVWISCGQHGTTIGVTSNGKAFFRTGTGEEKPSGDDWESIGSDFANVAVGDDGVIWGVHSDNSIEYRTDVSSSKPSGSDWGEVDGQLKLVAIGTHSVWMFGCFRS